MRLLRSTALLPPALLVTLALTAAPAAAQIDVGSDGSDGVFHPLSNVEIDLATEGTYDPALWRVVFHYQSVHVPAGVVVTFKNHPSRAPVVWLSQGDVLIEGEVVLNGSNGSVPPNYTRAEPGPGGFRGGAGASTAASSHTAQTLSAGLGPGGGFSLQNAAGGGAGHETGGAIGYQGGSGGDAYGDPEVTWLIGGSGGAGGGNGSQAGGGAGGGAILIASDTSVAVGSNGGIGADGGDGLNTSAGGSGGVVRIVADHVAIQPGAFVHAHGGLSPWVNAYGDGAEGRIRLEANTFALENATSPDASIGTPGPIVPPPGSQTARIVEVGGMPTPADPIATLGAGNAQTDVQLTSGLATSVVIQTTNVPPNAIVWLRVTRDAGQAALYQVTDGTNTFLTPTGGPDQEATATWTGNLAAGASAMQVRVVLPTL